MKSQAVYRDHSSITSSKRWVDGIRKWQFLMIYSTAVNRNLRLACNYWQCSADLIIHWSSLKIPKGCFQNMRVLQQKGFPPKLADHSRPRKVIFQTSKHDGGKIIIIVLIFKGHVTWYHHIQQAWVGFIRAVGGLDTYTGIYKSLPFF